jgi:hypothetical protein
VKPACFISEWVGEKEKINKQTNLGKATVVGKH